MLFLCALSTATVFVEAKAGVRYFQADMQVLGQISQKPSGHRARQIFVAKLKIALKEANETQYWLRLLKETHYISDRQYLSMSSDLEEILKILTAICKHYPQNNL